MLSRWAIEESPTKRDPQRRLLFVKGSLADVHGLIRKLGAVCGRPKKEKGGSGFNFSLALRKVSEEDLSEIEAELRAISPNGGPAAEGAAPAAAASPQENAPDSAGANGDGLPIEIALASGQAPAPLEESPPAVSTPKAEALPQVEAAPAEPALPAAEAAPPSEAAAPADSAIPLTPAADEEVKSGEAQAQVGEPIGGLSLSPGPEDPNLGAASESVTGVPGTGAPAPEGGSPFAGQGPPIAVRSEETAGTSPSTPDPAPLQEAFAQQEPAGDPGVSPLARQPLFGAVTERVPNKTLDNLIVGAFNRFAHAGAMSILTSPGTLYQPLFVSGLPGSGKSHLLHALADKLQQQNPDDPVWITSGARLARAAAWAISENRFGELEEYADKARALIIDDLQFMGIADHNRVQLAALLKKFSEAEKQIVLASAYPAEAVAAIEQSLEIRISGGHAVEVKTPSGDKQAEVVKSALESIGLAAGGAEFDAFVQATVARFPELSWILRRVLVLMEQRAVAGQSLGLGDLHPLLFQDEAGEPQVIAAEDLEKQSAEIPAPAGGQRKLVLLYPQGQEAHAEWSLRQAAVAAQLNSWPWPFSDAIRKPYAVDPAATVPFLLAEEAFQSGAEAALVLGPQPGAELAENEGDCRYVLQHLLSDGGVSLGWVPYRRVHDAKFHLHAFLDLQPAPGGGAADSTGGGVGL
jgi:hypothetical protein